MESPSANKIRALLEVKIDTCLLRCFLVQLDVYLKYMLMGFEAGSFLGQEPGTIALQAFVLSCFFLNSGIDHQKHTVFLRSLSM